MSLAVKELLDARAELVKKTRDIFSKAEKEGRALNSEERSECEKLDAEIDKLTDQINSKRYQDDKAAKHAALESGELGRQISPSNPGSTPPVRSGDGAALSVDFGRYGRVMLRPGSQEHLRAQPGYLQTYLSYLRGDRRDFEQLGLVVGNDPKGGYTAPMSFVAIMLKFLDDMVWMRPLATVLPPTTAKSSGAVSFDTDLADADWTAEIPASDISEDDAIRFGTRELTPHMLTKLVKCGVKLLRNSSLDLESFIAKRMAYRFALPEEKAFLLGTGDKQPLGVFVPSDNGIPTSRDTTCVSGTAFTGDELIDLTYSLKEPYRSRATWVVHREFVKRCRKLKDGNGAYIWAAGLQGTPDTILDRPVRSSEFAPSTFTTGQYVAAFGDFSYYWIQDGMGLETQRLEELFALRNQVGWITRKETDGMPALAEAFGRLKLG